MDKRSVVKIPQVPILASQRKWRYKYFGNHRGPLHLIEIYGACDTMFNIFLMKEDYARWVFKYQKDILEAIAVNAELRSSLPVPVGYSVLAFLLLLKWRR